MGEDQVLETEKASVTTFIAGQNSVSRRTEENVRWDVTMNVLESTEMRAVPTPLS
jgi:hypothetical protein